MTPEEYKERLAALRQEEKALNEKVKELKRAWVLQCPFNIGDKVKVIQWYGRFGQEDKYREAYCFIGGITNYYDDATWRYDFRKIKKDGTMSGQSAGIYLGTKDRIDLIESAPKTK